MTSLGRPRTAACQPRVTFLPSSIRAAENGATVVELEAIFGWQGGHMALLYTREANRARLVRDAMHKLANDDRTSIPAPEGEARAPERKP